MFKLRPGQLPTEKRRWVSAPAARPAKSDIGVRYFPTWREALERAVRKAYGR